MITNTSDEYFFFISSHVFLSSTLFSLNSLKGNKNSFNKIIPIWLDVQAHLYTITSQYV